MTFHADCPRDVARHLRHFDSVYAAKSDPWGARTSHDEAHKRRAIKSALGPHSYARGLEIGCGNGISTRALAPHFLNLMALDGSGMAVVLARQEVAGLTHVKIAHAALPCTLPKNGFDAIIASEVLYYLPRGKLTATLRMAHRALRRGGSFVSTHHLKYFNDAECDHISLVRATRAVFGGETRQLIGYGWRCYLYLRR